jgi:hypothetical protein
VVLINFLQYIAKGSLKIKNVINFFHLYRNN